MIMTVTSMLDNVLRIATRQSPLALWQAHYVKDKLMASHPGLVVELVPMVTRGDVILDTPLAKVGGKGLFVKELEVALLENRADIAVHSMKDVPVEFPQGLGLVTICEREDPRDAFVSNNYDSLDALPAGSIVGTSSLRRQCQLAERRPDLIIRSLRGNVGTRLSKLDNGEYDAIYGNTMAERIKSVRLDDKVKAVVLRVNSPGGSALASDVIWRELELLKAEKPVIVSMGGYAASGGYYISAPADVIIADKMTLTGSIGVFGMYMNVGKALKDKLGITFDGVKTNTLSDFGNATRPMTAVERATIMRSVDNVYETFTGLVAKGRNLPVEKVLDIAGGRVWSGSEAVELGLADGNGGLKTAIAVAADKAALGENYRIVEVTEMPTGLMSFFTAFNAQVRERALRSELGSTLYGHYDRIREAMRVNGVVAYCPYDIRFE